MRKYRHCNKTDFKHFVVALMMVNTEKLLLIFQTVILFHLSLTLTWQFYWILGNFILRSSYGEIPNSKGSISSLKWNGELLDIWLIRIYSTFYSTLLCSTCLLLLVCCCGWIIKFLSMFEALLSHLYSLKVI